MGTFKTPSVSFKKIILSYLLCLLVITEASAGKDFFLLKKI